MENDNIPTFADGQTCCAEIPAADISASADFYKKVFGWTVRTRDNGSLAFDDAAGEANCARTGIRVVPEIGVLIRIVVKDINTTIDAIAANGGKIVPDVDSDAPEIVAKFTDPAGKTFGLYQVSTPATE
jgi:Predicted enzyme related to lactoylglutathione lyase